MPIGGMLTSLYAARQARGLRQAATAEREATRLQPFSTTTGLGTARFDPITGEATTALDPRFASLQEQLLGQAGGAFSGLPLAEQATERAGGFLSQLGFDPFEAAQERFERMESILQPGRTARRGALASQLLRQGRLGSISTDREGNIIGGGAADLLSQEQAIERERANILNQALRESEAARTNLANLGIGLGGLGESLRGGALSRGLSALQGATGLEGGLFNQLGFGLQGSTAASQALLATHPAIMQTEALKRAAKVGAFSSFMNMIPFGNVGGAGGGGTGSFTGGGGTFGGSGGGASSFAPISMFSSFR